MNLTDWSRALDTQLPATTARIPGDYIELGKLAATAWRQRWVVIATMTLVLALALAYVLASVPKYTAKTQILIENRRQEIVDFKAVLSGLPQDRETILSEIEVLRSRGIARRVIEQMQLDQDHEFNPVPASDSVVAGDPLSIAQAKSAIIDGFLSKLRVVPVEQSRIISLGFTSENPLKAARIVNTLAERYIQEQREIKLEATQRASEWLFQKVASLRKQVVEAERAVAEFQQKNRLLEGYDGMSLLSQNLAELNSELSQAITASTRIESRLQQVTQVSANSGRIDSLAAALQLDALQQLRLEEQKLERALADLTARYSERSLSVRGKRAELNLVRDRIANEIRKTVTGIELEAVRIHAHEESLRQRIALLERGVAEANVAVTELNALEREAESSRALLEALLARLNATTSQQDIELQTADARIVSPADVPSTSISPAKPAVLLAALLGSGFLGVLLAFLVEHLEKGFHGERLETAFRSGAQIEYETGAPVLGAVPRLGWSARLRQTPVAYQANNPQSDFTASIRNLYVHLLLSQVDSSTATPPKKILITSALSGEGRTTTAVCLARAQALAGQRVVVVDADLRSPGVHRAFDMQEQEGLVELLVKKAKLEDILWTDRVSGIDVIQAGMPLRDPADLLASKPMDKLLDELAADYDLVIVDSPPLMSAADARILARKVEVSLFVLRWGTTDREVANLAVKRITAAGAHLAGVLMTMVDPKHNNDLV